MRQSRAETMTLINQLDALEASGLVRLAMAQPELEYLFSHALVQDAAYSSLVKADRRILHRDIGEVLERIYADRLDEFAPLLAHHFYEADNPSQALKYFTRAGDLAAAKYANTEAIMHYSRALAVVMPIVDKLMGSATRLFSHLYTKLGRVLELSGQYDLALANYEAMQRLAGERGDRTLELSALLLLVQTHSTPNPYFDAVQGYSLSEQALTLARELGDRQAEAKIFWNLVNLCVFTGRLSEGIGYGERSLSLSRELGLREQLAFTLNDLWRAYIANGQWEQALESLNEASLLWRELNNLPMLTDSLSNTAQMYSFGGQYEQALRLAEQALELSRSIHNTWGESYSQFAIGRIHWDRGEPDRAIDVMESCVRLSEEADFTAPQAYTRAELAWVYGSLGAVQHGIELAQLAVQQADAHMPAMRPQSLARLASLYLLNGNEAEAATTLRAAHVDFTPNPLIAASVFQADIELALALCDYTHALHVADELIAYLARMQQRDMSADALYLKGRALLESRRTDEAYGILSEARAEAEAVGSRRMLWPVCMALSEIEGQRGNIVKAQTLRQQAKEIIEYVADHISSPELCASFLTLPDVRAVIGTT